MAALAQARRHLLQGWRGLHDFISQGIWDTDYTQASGWRWFGLRQLQVALLVAKGSRQSSLILRTQALALITLISVVPILAIVFSVFEVSGGLSSFQRSVEEFVLEHLAVGAREEVVTWIRTFVGNANAGAIGGLGFGVLLLTAGRAIAALEGAFNDIWAVRRGRPLLSKIFLYWSILTVGPVLLAASLGASAWLRGWVLTAPVLRPWLARPLTLLPIAISTLGLGLLYYVVPNTRVKLRHALLGGAFAAALVEIAKVAYAVVARYLVNYDAVYGSLGAIPIFIIWVTIVWHLVLFGCQLAFANQNVTTLRQEQQVLRASERTREQAGLAIMVQVSRAFLEGLGPPHVEALVRALGYPVRLLAPLTEQLCEAGLLREVALGHRRDPGYMPARPPAQTPVWAVLEALRGAGDPAPEAPNEAPARLLATEEVLSAEREAAAHLGARSLQDLAEGCAPAV